MQSNNPNISISLPQIYRASGTASERPDAERNGLIPDTIRCVPTSVFSTCSSAGTTAIATPPRLRRACTSSLGELRWKGDAQWKHWASYLVRCLSVLRAKHIWYEGRRRIRVEIQAAPTKLLHGLLQVALRHSTRTANGLLAMVLVPDSARCTYRKDKGSSAQR
jgi:hypothetical protein